MAKKIVSDMMDKRNLYVESCFMDSRLRALVDYYFARELFSPDPTVAATARNAIERYSKCNKGPGGAVVIMRSEDEMYDGYRFFIIKHAVLYRQSFRDRLQDRWRACKRNNDIL